MSKKITLELTKEQYEKIKDQLGLGKEISPFDRVEHGGNYYFIGNSGEICDVFDDTNFALKRYNIANYSTDKQLMQQRAYYEILNRLLWRFSMMNGGSEIDWDNKNQTKYSIYYNFACNMWSTNYFLHTSKYFEPYFISEEVAERAIDEIIKPFMEKHPDFKF